MVAMVNISVFMEIAPDSSSFGTRFGTIAWPAGAQKLRPTPNKAAMKNSRMTSSRPTSVNAQQCRGRDQLESVGERDDEPAIEAVGDLPAGQQQHDERQELREADVARGTPLCASAPTPGSRGPRRSSARPASPRIGRTRSARNRDGSAPGGQAIGNCCSRSDGAGCWGMRTLTGNVALRWPLRPVMREAVR